MGAAQQPHQYGADLTKPQFFKLVLACALGTLIEWCVAAPYCVTACSGLQRSAAERLPVSSSVRARARMVRAPSVASACIARQLAPALVMSN